MRVEQFAMNISEGSLGGTLNPFRSLLLWGDIARAI